MIYQTSSKSIGGQQRTKVQLGANLSTSKVSQNNSKDKGQFHSSKIPYSALIVYNKIKIIKYWNYNKFDLSPHSDPIWYKFMILTLATEEEQ